MRVLLLAVLLYPLLLTAQSQKPADIYGEGVRAYYAEDYPTALKKYTDALSLKPNTVGYLYSRALTYRKLDLDSLASLDLKRVIRLDTNYIDAWYELGMINMVRKKYDTAFVLFTHALRISKNDVRTLHQVGLLYYYQRENGKAIEVYNKIVTIDPDDAQAYYKRGLAEFNEEDFDGAVLDFSETYKIDPDNTLAVEQRAISYMRLNDLESACRDWALLQKKGNPRARESIAKYCGKD